MKNANRESLDPGEFASTWRPVARTYLGKQIHAGLLLLLAILCSSAAAQTNEWAWMNGPVTANSADCVYGSLGTAAPENTPGARLGATTWADKKGNLWLYGGQIFGPGDCGGSDLWEFSLTTNEWALIKGIAYGGVPVYGTKGTPSPDNTPGLRGAEVSWTDASGNLWLFGGTSRDSNGLDQYRDDVWEFNPTINEWTWMSGSNALGQAGVYGTKGIPSAGNTPGARYGSNSWVDSQGNVWLFGGEGCDSTGTPGKLNDLWELNLSTGLWTWVNGPDVANQPAVPGTMGVPAPGNVPGSGYNANWIDKQGNLWLFGNFSGLDDMWKYSPATNEWTWMKGDTTVQPLNDPSQPPAAIYGTFETPAPGNTPGGRLGTVSWTDQSGNFWLFGGSGHDADGVLGYLNDLWELNPSTIEWAWMGGSSVAVGSCPQTAFTCGQPGVYGTLLTAELGDTPGGRYDDAAWTDSNGNFWLFGGFGFDQTGNGGYLDDLWEYQPNTNNNQVAGTPTLSLASGTYTSWQTLTISDSTPGASIYYTLNGNVPAAEYAGPLTVSSSETIQAIASANGYANSDIATANYTLNLPATPAPTFSLPSGSYSSAQSVTISDSIPGASIYYAVSGVPAGTFNVYSGPISVSTSEEIQAFAVADNDSGSSMTTAEYNVGPLPATSALWTWMSGPSALANYCDVSGVVSSLCVLPGWYGTLGQPSIGNTPGGRNAAAGWTDNAGNLWLFGGNGFDGAGADGLLNDLWKFDPSTDEWTWMGGSAIVGDSCPQQVAGEYCGKPRVYGTQGEPAPGNVPGGRQWPTYWTDKNGHFWLFGGEGFDGNGVLGYLDDLWEYDPSTHEWTWVGGHNAFPGLFGGFPAVNSALGIPSPQNWPGTRWYTTSWTDPNGHLWMYGGQGEGISFIGFSYLSDLWEYDPSTNEWVWKNGVLIPSCEQCGWLPTDGSLGAPAPLNSPGSRMMSEGWADSGGHLWLFAGWNTDTYAESYLEDDQ